MSNASAETQALVAVLLEGHRAIRIVNYVTMGSFALVIWDFVLTLGDEVRLMWSAPLSIPKVLFFVLRYYIFVNNLFWAMYLYPRDLPPETCLAAFERITIKFVPFPFTGLHCLPAELEHKLLTGVFALLLANIIVIMGIMMYLAFMKHKNLKSSLLRVFYRDGIFYFILLSSFAIANIAISTIFADGGVRYLFVNMEVNFHAILSTRMLLHIRLWAEKDQHRVGFASGCPGRPGVGGYTASRLISPIRFKTHTSDIIVSQGSGTVARDGSHWS